MRTPTSRLWIHHTADAGVAKDATLAQEAAYARSIQAFHMDTRGYSDIAYSFLVMPSGRILVGRGWGVTGAHTLNFNDSSHALCFAGTFTSRRPTAAAIAAARELIADGIRRKKLTKTVTIDGHRNAAGNSTSCPGDKLMGLLDELTPKPETRSVWRIRIDGASPKKHASLRAAVAAIRAAFKGDAQHVTITRDQEPA